MFFFWVILLIHETSFTQDFHTGFFHFGPLYLFIRNTISIETLFLHVPASSRGSNWTYGSSSDACPSGTCIPTISLHMHQP